MTSFGVLTAFHGALATLVLVGLIFAEESGFPLLLSSGDLLLLSAGVLIATGAMPAWIFLPAATVAAIGGGLVGYTWANRLGAGRLHALARRLRMDDSLQRVEGRIRAAGVPGIMVARLFVPGMRINTTLVCGALNISRRTFVVALIPSVVIWVLVVTGLGMLAGIPIAAFMQRVNQALVQGGELVALGLAGYLAARYAGRRPEEESLVTAAAGHRLRLAVVIDVGVLATIVAGIDVATRALISPLNVDALLDAAITVAFTALVYFLATRGVFGRTAGEALLRVSYRSPSRAQSRPGEGGAPARQL